LKPKQNAKTVVKRFSCFSQLHCLRKTAVYHAVNRTLAKNMEILCVTSFCKSN